MYYEELYHHGIKGMKWGIRRTPEQLGHIMDRKKSEMAAKKAERDKRIHDKLVTSRNPKYLYKHRDLLTDQELRDRLNRVQMEAQLRQAAKKNVNTIQAVGSSAKQVGTAADKIGKAAKIISLLLTTAAATKAAAKVATGNPSAVADIGSIVSSAMAGSTKKLIWGA